MGTDIHWVIERKHSDGAWEAALCKSYTFWQWRTLHNLSNDWFIADPAMNLMSRDYTLFGLLSDLREEMVWRGETLAIDGFPEDASPYSLASYDEDGDLHSHGHITLGRLQEAAHGPGLEKVVPDPEHRELIRGVLKSLDQLAADHNGKRLDHIMVGVNYGETDGATDDGFVQMRNLSSHERLSLAKRAEGLLPIGPDTLRILICYDN